MTNWYVDRDAVKQVLSIPAATTGDHALIDAAIEGVSRLIDEYVKLPLYAHVATRYQTPDYSDCLYLDTPLISLSSLRTDTDDNASYETTWSTGAYWLTGMEGDANVRSASPPHPYWEIHTRTNATVTFPTGVMRGVELTGTWGYFDERKTIAAAVASTPWDATATSVAVTNSSTVHAGNTLLVETEQVFVNNVVTSTSNLLVERAVNGTSGSAHASGTTIQVYQYPVVSEAAKFQVLMDLRAKDTVGGYPGENAPNRTAIGGLHPFTKSMLTMRAPTVR